MTNLPRRLGSLLTGALLLLAASPASAQKNPDLEKYLPADTNVVVRIHTKQILGAELLRKTIPAVAHKYGDQFLEMMKAFGALDENLSKALKDGSLEAFVNAAKDREKVNQTLDLIKDMITEIIVAGDSHGDEPKFLIFVRSPQINAPLVNVMLGFAERSQPGLFKKDKIGKHTVYEVTPPNQDVAFFMTVPADGWLIIAMGKDHLKASLEAAENSKDTLSKEFKELLSQFKPAQSVFVVGLKEEDGKKQITHGFITMDDGITVDFTLNAGSAEAAKEKAKELTDTIEEGLANITGLVNEVEEAKPLIKELEAIKAVAEGDKVVVKTRIGAKVFEPLLKIEKKDEEKKDKKNDKTDKSEKKTEKSDK